MPAPFRDPIERHGLLDVLRQQQGAPISDQPYQGVPWGLLWNWAKEDPVDAALVGGSVAIPSPIGDIVGGAADAKHYWEHPEDLTLGNIAMSAAGVAVPGIPAMAGTLSKARKAVDKASTDLSAGKARKKAYDDAVKKGAKRMGVSEDAFDAMARQGRVAPQIAPISSKTGREVGFEPGYSKGLKPKVHLIDEMDAGLARKQKKRPDKMVEVDSLLGKVLVPMPGDRTSRDLVTSVMGRKITPERLEGGYPYMADKSGWASGESVISSYKNIFDELGGRGVGVGKVMSGTGSDYSRMSTDLMYKRYDMDGMPRATKAALKKEVNIEIDQANAAAIKKAKQKAIDEGSPYEAPKIQKPFKGFDKNTKKLLDKDPALRKAVMGALDKDRSRKLPGAPDAIAIRHAITDDRFRDLRRGNPDPLSGFDFMSFPAGGKIRPANHKSYTHHLGGEHLGRLPEGPVPTTVLFPDFAKQMAKEGRKPSQYNYMFDRLKPTQEVDERVVQGLLDYYASLRK